MEQFIVYMAKASGLIALFYAAYHIFLRKETFFVSNRWFLLSGLGTALALPLVFFKKIVWTNTSPIQEVSVINANQLQQLQETPFALSNTITFSWPNLIFGVYIAGVLFLTIKLLLNIIQLKQIIKNQSVIKEGQYKLIDTPRVNAPFSFFNYIVYNSAVLQPNELESIICHEKAHSRQYHSADMLIGQLTAIFFWFNPFAWLYKSSISQNLEFIADAVATKQISDSTAYQKTLLKVTLQLQYISITNNFYQSLIKKRIVMMNKNKSRKANAAKYSLVIPALAAFMLLFQVKTIAQSKAANNISNLTTTIPATEAAKVLIYDMYGKQWYANQADSQNNITVIIDGRKVKNNDTNLKKGIDIVAVNVLKKKNTLEIITKKASKNEASGKSFTITIDTMPELKFMSFNKYNVEQLKSLVTQELKELK
ncbi:M48 family metalloprotease [Flavobacterium rakeshii]|uniref:M48 family metalloprotease n=1 Tax=Flavobacterium rakeshii TaxID=1038845 RepID=A0A6N8H8Z2_9FLAO|nr:M56 family metallopeptidase [Flavobacterium rakeshii]MUV02971.1 M48 family metalloprotease [Flavobacterium rakeshii]